jgi:uncharacterized integral membrane protein
MKTFFLVLSWVALVLGLILAVLCVIDKMQGCDKSGLFAYFFWLPAVVLGLLGLAGVQNIK